MVAGTHFKHLQDARRCPERKAAKNRGRQRIRSYTPSERGHDLVILLALLNCLARSLTHSRYSRQSSSATIDFGDGLCRESSGDGGGHGQLLELYEGSSNDR